MGLRGSTRGFWKDSFKVEATKQEPGTDAWQDKAQQAQPRREDVALSGTRSRIFFNVIDF